MSFEEDFPSLINKGGWRLIDIDKNDVRNCCLDKQKVKEAIENMVFRGFPHYIEPIIDDLKKELGLDK